MALTPSTTMTAVYLSVTVAPGEASQLSTIDYEVQLVPAAGPPRLLEAQLVSLASGDAIVVIPLGERLEVVSLAIEIQADFTVATINEVYYRDCP